MKYWRLYLQYMNPTLTDKGRYFEEYITFAPTKEEAIEKVTSYSWEIWAETEVLHVESLGEHKRHPVSWPAADKSIFDKKSRKRRSRAATDRSEEYAKKKREEKRRKRKKH